MLAMCFKRTLLMLGILQIFPMVRFGVVKGLIKKLHFDAFYTEACSYLYLVRRTQFYQS